MSFGVLEYLCKKYPLEAYERVEKILEGSEVRGEDYMYISRRWTQRGDNRERSMCYSKMKSMAPNMEMHFSKVPFLQPKSKSNQNKILEITQQTRPL